MYKVDQWEQQSTDARSLVCVIVQVDIAVLLHCTHFLHANLEFILEVLPKDLLQNLCDKPHVVVLVMDVNHVILLADLQTGVFASNCHISQNHSVSLNHSCSNEACLPCHFHQRLAISPTTFQQETLPFEHCSRRP